MSKKLEWLLMLFIFIEGVFTLSLELISIRQVIPFAGNGTEVVAIIISGVLLPLSLGYYYGGKRWKKLLYSGKKRRVRDILSNNIFQVVFLTGLGFSYVLMFFYFSQKITGATLLDLFFYLIPFLIYPTFLLGQTVPLITNYFKSDKMAEMTGKVLFVSTLGSFAGSLFTVLFLMNVVGVSNTLFILEALLLFMAILISKDKARSLSASFLLLSVIFFLSFASKKVFHIEYENRYNTVSVINHKDRRILMANNSWSSAIDDNLTGKFAYVRLIEGMIRDMKNKEVLVIGAGGFALGAGDLNNHYTYVDVDPELQKVAESKFLKRKLDKNKEFVRAEVRKYLHENNKKYDIVILDAFTNKISIPFSLLSVEFFDQLKNVLRDKNSVFIANIASDPLLRDKFSRRVNNTLRAVFPLIAEIPVQQKEISLTKEKYINVVYIGYKDKKDDLIYTDDKNRCLLDKKD